MQITITDQSQEEEGFVYTDKFGDTRIHFGIGYLLINNQYDDPRLPENQEA